MFHVKLFEKENSLKLADILTIWNVIKKNRRDLIKN